MPDPIVIKHIVIFFILVISMAGIMFGLFLLADSLLGGRLETWMERKFPKPPRSNKKYF